MLSLRGHRDCPHVQHGFTRTSARLDHLQHMEWVQASALSCDAIVTTYGTGAVVMVRTALLQRTRMGHDLGGRRMRTETPRDQGEWSGNAHNEGKHAERGKTPSALAEGRIMRDGASGGGRACSFHSFSLSQRDMLRKGRDGCRKTERRGENWMHPSPRRTSHVPGTLQALSFRQGLQSEAPVDGERTSVPMYS